MALANRAKACALVKRPTACQYATIHKKSSFISSPKGIARQTLLGPSALMTGSLDGTVRASSREVIPPGWYSNIIPLFSCALLGGVAP